MKQRYIDAEKLLSKIVKKNNQLVSLMNKLYYAANYKEWEAELNTYGKIISLIKSLQQEQSDVDLEKEIENRIKECLDVKFPTTDIELIKKDVEYTARKFYELGKNARKDE